jgi:hypothetical protein
MIKNEQIQSIEIPKYWKLSNIHKDDVKKMIDDFYKPLEKFYGNETIKNVLNEIIKTCTNIDLLSKETPLLTKINILDKEIYNVFDKRIVTLLFEYYLLSIFTEYINLASDAELITKMLVVPGKHDEGSELYSSDFLVEQQLRFSESEQEYLYGDVNKLKENVAKLLVSYLTMMMDSKKTIDVSFKDIEDKVFRLKEAEKYTFTDRLKDLDDEERKVDNILKQYKLGPIYSIGLSKGLKEYDPDNFDYDKKVAENVAEIQNRLRKNGVDERNMDLNIEDEFYELEIEDEIQRDNGMNDTEDYDDGDPWGDEIENDED